MPDLPDILRHTQPRRLKTAGVVALCVAAGVVALGVIDRVHADQRLTSWTSARAIPTVNLVSLNGGVACDCLRSHRHGHAAIDAGAIAGVLGVGQRRA